MVGCERVEGRAVARCTDRSGHGPFGDHRYGSVDAQVEKTLAVSGTRGAQRTQIDQLIDACAVARPHNALVGVQAAAARVGVEVVGGVGVGPAWMAVERRTILLLLLTVGRQSLARESTWGLRCIAEVAVFARPVEARRCS